MGGAASRLWPTEDCWSVVGGGGGEEGDVSVANCGNGGGESTVVGVGSASGNDDEDSDGIVAGGSVACRWRGADPEP